MRSFLSEEVKEHFTRKAEDYRHWSYKPSFFNVKIPEGKKVFEAGCGAKFVFTSASEKYGVDITKVLLRSLRREKPDINLVVSDARFLPFRSGVFFVASAVFLLHHLVGWNALATKANIKKCLAELKRVSDKKGYIFIDEHLASNWFISMLFFYVTLICAKLNLNFDYLDIHAKVVTYYLDEKTFKKIVRSLGLKAKIIGNLPWKFRNISIGHDRQFILQNTSGH